MKKYWLALKNAIAEVPVVLFLLLFVLLGENAPAPYALLHIGWVVLLLLLMVFAMCWPLGVWTLCWVDETHACQQHMLTRRTRQMPLDAPYTYRWETSGGTKWFVLSAVPLNTVKEAQRMHRQGKTMCLPLEGPLVKALAARAKAAPRLYEIPQIPGRKHWTGAAMVRYGFLFLALCLIQQIIRGFFWGITLLYSIVLAMVLVYVWCRTSPVGPWQLCWVEDDVLHMQHILTRRHRDARLDDAHQCYVWNRESGVWLVVTETLNVPITTDREARLMYERGEVLMVPVTGPMEAALRAYMENRRAPELNH